MVIGKEEWHGFYLNTKGKIKKSVNEKSRKNDLKLFNSEQEAKLFLAQTTPRKEKRLRYLMGELEPSNLKIKEIKVIENAYRFNFKTISFESALEWIRKNNIETLHRSKYESEGIITIGKVHSDQTKLNGMYYEGFDNYFYI